MADDAVLALGTAYAAKRWAKKAGRRTRRSRRGGVGAVDDAILAGTTAYAAHRWGKKAGRRTRRR
jgi:hypothetical protein